MKNISSVGIDCCGCSGCEQICPVECISFDYDKEGFLYPKVNNDLCIICEKCINCCPVVNPPDLKEPMNVMGMKYTEQNHLMKSSSGGVFFALAQSVLQEGGIVVGCAFDDSLTAKHIVVDNCKNLSLLQSSKYVQSDNCGIYSQVREYLQNGKMVLYSGTGCQVAGLRNYLNKEYNKLLCVDVVCHGVPSPKLFKNYIEYLEIITKSKVQSYNFRSKTKDGWGLNFEFKNEKGMVRGIGTLDPYYSAFLKCSTYRESCYKCVYACYQRAGDITLADFWGIEFLHPDYYDKRGVSLVLINTERGTSAINNISSQITSFSATKEEAIQMNRNLVHPSERPEERDTIYDGYDDDLVTYFGRKMKVNDTCIKKVKRLIPITVKGKIKYYLRNMIPK